MTTVKMTKGIFTSKINWVALLIFILAGAANPVFWTQICGFVSIPESFITFASQVASALVFVFRTYYTNVAVTPPPFNQEIPEGGPDVVVK